MVSADVPETARPPPSRRRASGALRTCSRRRSPRADGAYGHPRCCPGTADRPPPPNSQFGHAYRAPPRLIAAAGQRMAAGTVPRAPHAAWFPTPADVPETARPPPVRRVYSKPPRRASAWFPQTSQKQRVHRPLGVAHPAHFVRTDWRRRHHNTLPATRRPGDTAGNGARRLRRRTGIDHAPARHHPDHCAAPRQTGRAYWGGPGGTDTPRRDRAVHTVAYSGHLARVAVTQQECSDSTLGRAAQDIQGHLFSP